MWLLTNKFQHCYQSLKDGFFLSKNDDSDKTICIIGYFLMKECMNGPSRCPGYNSTTSPARGYRLHLFMALLQPASSSSPPPPTHQPRPPAESTSGNLKEGTSNKLVHSMWINLLCGRIVSVYVKQTSSKLMKNRSTIWGANQTELSWTRLL